MSAATAPAFPLMLLVLCLCACGPDAAAPAPPWAAAPPPPRMLYAHDVQAPEGADADTVEIGVRFTNAADADSGPFVPLLVLMDDGGQELRESYAAPLQLRHGESGEARFVVALDGLASGRYFIAVLPSHPDTGKRMGKGVYRVPLKVRCCAPGGGARVRP